MLDLVLAGLGCAAVYSGAFVLTDRLVSVPLKREEGKFVPLEAKIQWFFKQNLVSLYYSLVCTLIEVIVLSWYGMGIHRESYWLERFYFCHTLGFFLYDAVAKVKYDILNTFVTIHHILGSGFCIYALMDDYVCSLAAVGLFLFEVTHPFLVLKEALEWINYPQESLLYLANLWIFCVCFIFCRGYTFYCTYLAMTTVEVSIGLTMFTVPNQALTCIWVLQMVGKLWKTLPFWFPTPKEIEKSTWWINGRSIIKKYTREKPHTHFLEGAIYLSVLVYPIVYAYYLRS